GLSLDVNLERRLEQRPLEQSRNVIRDESRGRQTVIENFHLDLPAVRVPRERKFDAEFGSAIETVGIVRQHNVGDIPAYKRLDVRESLRSMAVEVAFFLVIDADEVELRATKFEDGVFLAQHLHAMLRVKLFGELFRVRIDLVIAVAAEDTERRMKAANLFDAIFDRVVRSGDEIAGHDGEVGVEIVGHVHGAPNGGAAHERAHVNVADLGDFHAVESGRQVGDGDF